VSFFAVGYHVYSAIPIGAVDGNSGIPQPLQQRKTWMTIRVFFARRR
jgi:hypothetical protein